MATSLMTDSKPNIFKWLSAYGPVLVWASIIFAFSSRASWHTAEVSTLDFFIKKIAHITEYAILYLLSARAWDMTIPSAKLGRYWVVPIVFCLLYAVSDEWHQSWVPGRYPNIRDVGFDMVGVGLAFLVRYRYI